MLPDRLQRSHVKEWWSDGDDTLDQVAAHYASDRDNKKRFVARLDGQNAGYVQYHRLGLRLIGADQFLGSGDQLSSGIGTLCLMAFVDVIVRPRPGHPASALHSRIPGSAKH
jgi:hypothetical protein